MASELPLRATLLASQRLSLVTSLYQRFLRSPNFMPWFGALREEGEDFLQRKFVYSLRNCLRVDTDPVLEFCNVLVEQHYTLPAPPLATAPDGAFAHINPSAEPGVVGSNSSLAVERLAMMASTARRQLQVSTRRRVRKGLHVRNMRSSSITAFNSQTSSAPETNDTLEELQEILQHHLEVFEARLEQVQRRWREER